MPPESINGNAMKVQLYDVSDAAASLQLFAHRKFVNAKYTENSRLFRFSSEAGIFALPFCTSANMVVDMNAKILIYIHSKL